MALTPSQLLDVLRTIPGREGLLAGEYRDTREALVDLVRLIRAGADMRVLAEAADRAEALLPNG